MHEVLENFESDIDDSKTSTRVWAFIIYPDELKNDWLWRMKNLCMPLAISPVHDKDFKKDLSGFVKKHMHVMVAWDGPSRFTAAQKVSNLFNGVRPEAVRSPVGYFHYFTHEFETDKVTYSRDDIITFCGFDAEKYETLSKAQIRKFRMTLDKVILEEKITSYYGLCQWALGNDIDLYDWLCVHTIEYKEKIFGALKDQKIKEHKEARKKSVSEVLQNVNADLDNVLNNKYKKNLD